MRRTDFLNELERLLSDLPEEERREALQYYEDYFADAGEEKEEEVIRELGSPQKVAESIRADYFGKNEEPTDSRTGHSSGHGSEYSSGYGQGYGSGNGTGSGAGYGTAYGPRDAFGDNAGMTEYAEQQKKSWWSDRTLQIVLIVLLALTLLPVAFGGVSTLAGIIISVLAMGVGLVAAGIAITVAGIAVVAAAFFVMAGTFSGALVMCGTGLLLLAIGMAVTVGSIKLCMIVYPAIYRGVVKLWKRLFQKN